MLFIADEVQSGFGMPSRLADSRRNVDLLPADVKW